MTEDQQDFELNEDEKELLREALNEEVDGNSFMGADRRFFLKSVSVMGAGLLLSGLLGEETYARIVKEGITDDLPAAAMENAVKVNFKINGATKSLTVDSRITLLDTLRERLQLTGSKKGCDHGQCGACTVVVDGKRILSCLTLAASCEGKSITSIEGLAKNGSLHPMQAAFIKHDGFQCGYCTPGQICSAIALVEEAKNGEASYVSSPADLQKATPKKLSLEEIKERMSGNICRCGAYTNIVDAIYEVQSGKDVPQNWNFVPEYPAGSAG